MLAGKPLVGQVKANAVALRLKIDSQHDSKTGSSARTYSPPQKPQAILTSDCALWVGDTEQFLKALPREPLFDLVVTSPPYNIGKAYEKKNDLELYLDWQKRIIDEVVPRVKPSGSICWQVGNFVNNGQIVPLDIEFAPIFKLH